MLTFAVHQNHEEDERGNHRRRSIRFLPGRQLEAVCAASAGDHFRKTDRSIEKSIHFGRGRCNLTNSFEGVTDLKQVYPRGHQLLKGLFKAFGSVQTYRWFEQHGVKLVTQDDHCVLPSVQDARAVTGCLERLAEKLGVRIRTSHRLEQIIPRDHRYELTFNSGRETLPLFDFVAVTTGGSPRKESLQYLSRMGHRIEQPVPSLFTFNIAEPALRNLMGIVADPVAMTIPGTKIRSSGALLVTHWGMSGPAVLKLSSYAARFIREKNDRVPILVNWLNESNGETVKEHLSDLIRQYPQKQLSGLRPYNLSARLWLYLWAKSGFPQDRKWNELGTKGLHKLIDSLCNDRYEVTGRSTFREEFVTCGGVSLDSIHRRTLESKTCPSLYFAGEVLDIDGVTGGFNLQAAWTTAYTVARSMADAIASRSSDGLLLQ